jgi:hypothetical protein
VKAHDAPPGTAELALQGLNLHHRCLKMLLEKLPENVHHLRTKDNTAQGRSELPGIEQEEESPP